MTDIRFEMTRSRARSVDHTAFRLLVALTYPLFLAAAMIARLLPNIGGSAAQSGQRVSIFAQARRSSEACIAFAFMG